MAYAIGVENPVMIEIDTFGTAKIAEGEILDRIKRTFDFTPEGMIKTLDLRTPRFLPTATFGHFGRECESFTWEALTKIESLR